jgi:2-keto-4-pentenoate hydratase/2-oxohepta-3-ene-1,7-dioic acid hydratase in catechol pathway
MRISTFFAPDGQTVAAFALAGGLVPVGRACAAGRVSEQIFFPCAKSVLELGRETVERAYQAALELVETGDFEPVPRESVALAAPVLTPEKIICVGLNYHDHAEEAGLEVPSHPVLFSKFANGLIGDGGSVVLPSNSSAIDYEGELAFVVGETCRDVPEARAFDVIAGLMVFNDVSARDLQLQTSQWLAGKALDTFAPCGPAIVTLDEIGDPSDLELKTRLNGAIVQQSRTHEMIFSVGEILAYTSSLMTLRPGDIVATGTPGGVGFIKDPPSYLVDGDVVEVEIQNVGLLSNPIVKAEAIPVLLAPELSEGLG